MEELPLKLLIVSDAQRLEEYNDFAKALSFFGVDALCVNDLDYCFVSGFKPLHRAPSPKLLKLVKEFNPDFVMTDSPYYIPHMARLVDRRVLFHMRGAEDVEQFTIRYDIAMYPSLAARAYTLYLEKLFKHSIKKVDIILPNCKWLENRIKQNLPNHKTHVLYVGVAPEKWTPSNETLINIKHPAVACVFQFTIYEKVIGLLKFANVVKKMLDVNFYIVGDGPYLKIVKKKYPLSNVFFAGRVSISEVKKLLENCDLFVHPSSLDALPRSVKEASLMEKAVIASNVGGIPEIVRNNQTGYLCDINNVDEWIEKIRFLLDNSDVARRFGKNARKYVTETFNWRKIAESFVKTLKTFRE